MIAFPFDCSISFFAFSLNSRAAIVRLCCSLPLPSTFPGIIIVSLGFVFLAILLMLTILLCLLGFSRSSAILFQSFAFCRVLSLRKICISSLVCMFVGPVLFVIFFVIMQGKGFEPSHPLRDKALNLAHLVCVVAFDQALPPLR